MATKEDFLKKIVSHAKEYGFVFPSSEIYEGLSAVYDYGQNGVELKNNIKAHWWKSMVQLNDNIVGIDAAILMHPTTWEASGHVSAFKDPLIDNKDSKKRYRADVLIESHLEKIHGKIMKEIDKAKKLFGDNFNPDQFFSVNKRVIRYNEEIDSINKRLVKALQENDLNELKQIIVDCEISDPESGSRNWTDVRQFNVMFQTEIGSGSEDKGKVYLRPETAQGIFVNFLNVQKTSRFKIPFGIAQIGKAFRNEIVARQFVFRMKEFEQMEMQFFVKPGDEMRWYEHWKKERMKWHQSLGLPGEKFRFHDHIKLAHYANAAVDIEFEFPMGFKELEGIHSRTDFDLKSHEKYSGKKLQYYDPETNESFIPYVVETSMGLDRMFLAVLSHAYTEEKLPASAKGGSASGENDGSEPDGEYGTTRTVLKIAPVLAPVKVAVFPLVKKDGLPEVAHIIFDNLKSHYNCQYEEKDTIGKRYRRQDAIGTPYCITIDQQTKEDNTVTLRDRDTMLQERIAIANISKVIDDKTQKIKAIKDV